jgi:hypothetical protein
MEGNAYEIRDDDLIQMNVRVGKKTFDKIKLIKKMTGVSHEHFIQDACNHYLPVILPQILKE